MTNERVERAKANALRAFDRWNEVSGAFARGTASYGEIQSIIEDAVSIGWNARIADEPSAEWQTLEGKLLHCPTCQCHEKAGCCWCNAPTHGTARCPWEANGIRCSAGARHQNVSASDDPNRLNCSACGGWASYSENRPTEPPAGPANAPQEHYCHSCGTYLGPPQPYQTCTECGRRYNTATCLHRG